MREVIAFLLLACACGAALSEQSRVETQRYQLGRLLDEVDTRLVELPFLFAEELGLEQLRALSSALEAGLS